MYECPSLLRMRDELTGEIRDVLIFSPQGMEPLGEKYNNIFQSGYIVGSLDNETLKFTVETPFTELDAGFEFYAPQTISGTGLTADPKAPHTVSGDAPVMIAWLGNAAQDDLPRGVTAGCTCSPTRVSCTCVTARFSSVRFRS